MHLAKAVIRGGGVRLGPFPVSADSAGAGGGHPAKG